MPDEAEVLGLLALMLLQDSRRAARVDCDGEIVLLEDQDRVALGRRADRRGNPRPRPRAVVAPAGPVPAAGGDRRGARAGAPARPRSSRCTRRCARSIRSPVVHLNRAVAVALAGEANDGLALLDEIEGLDDYHLLHAARADLYRRLDRRGGRDGVPARARACNERVRDALPRAPPG